MSDNVSEAEAKLQRIAERVRIGREVLHPATERDYKTVQDLIRQQWQQKQDIEKVEAEKPQSTKVKEAEELKQAREKEKAKAQESGQSTEKEGSQSKANDQQGQSGSQKPSQGQSQGQGHSH